MPYSVWILINRLRHIITAVPRIWVNFSPSAATLGSQLSISNIAKNKALHGLFDGLLTFHLDNKLTSCRVKNGRL